MPPVSKLARACTLASATLILVVGAVLNRGIANAEVDVNDGGIWVTNTALKLVGHLNYESHTIDAGFAVRNSQVELGQAEDTVTVQDKLLRDIAAVDPAAVKAGTAVSHNEDTVFAQGGSVVAALDTKAGMLWISDANDPTQVPFEESTAVAADLLGGVLAVGVDGTVVVVSAVAGRFVRVSSEGLMRSVDSISIPNVSADTELSLTLVGSQPVALDRNSNTLILPDGTTRWLEGVSTGGILQEPGPAADHVLLATDSALVSVPFNGSDLNIVQTTTTGGVPAAPVRLGGCEYAAWGVTGSYLRSCDQIGFNVGPHVTPPLVKAQRLKFRTNRELIVLNDLATGSVWLPDQNMTLAAGWEEINEQLKQQDDNIESPQITQRVADPERKKKNTPPTAEDDMFGVRPGRVTTLDVLNNDSDEDGDVLTARMVGDHSNISQTRGGQGLQIAVSEDATGEFTFNYEASDGMASDTAKVMVAIHPFSVNAAPVQLRADPKLQLGARATVKYNVLPDWRDPDGDRIFLKNASGSEGVAVQFREEGTVSVQDLGVGAGPIDIAVEVSDGQVSTLGSLRVYLQPKGNIPPVANADFYVAKADEMIFLHPLANDFDPNGDKIELIEVVSASERAKIARVSESDTYSFQARTVGVYYLTYQVTDQLASQYGVIRVDVIEDDVTAKPVAEDDLVLLPAGGQVLAGILSNDTDPAGGVLVVQQIGEVAGLEVTLIDHHMLRIAAPNGLDTAVSFPYTVSNGRYSATAQVMVVPTQPVDENQPPQLQVDRAKVRVGDIGSVPVLENDHSVAGLALEVSPQLEYDVGDALGYPFVTGSLVRLQAGDSAGFFPVTYTVRDSAGNIASSQVIFEVVADEQMNRPPVPQNLTAWAVNEQLTRIPVPVHNIDPDGDSVTLVGVKEAPALGSLALGIDSLEYTPGVDVQGTDVFSYIVEDRFGAQATASVRVGIAPPSQLNQPPRAFPDTVFARPGRQLLVPVTLNDTDPDGDQIHLIPGSVAGSGVRASVSGDSVTLVSPNVSDSYLVTYDISDGRGGTASGVLTVVVQSDSPLRHPVARDDVIKLNELPADGSPVAVPVLRNDEDPDGDSTLLQLSCSEAGVEVDQNVLVVEQSPKRRMIVYSITDVDGLVASAVVSLPGYEQQKPRINPRKVPLRVRAGQAVSIDLRDYVITRSDRLPRIVDASTLTGTAGFDGPPVLIGENVVNFQIAADFGGQTVLSFEVSDGSSADSSALSALLSIPIEVEAAINRPPKIVTNTIVLVPGEAGVDVDLAAVTTDPDGVDSKRFKYVLQRVPQGVNASIHDGYVLSLSVGVDHPRGAAGSLQFSVDDGAGMAEGSMPIVVKSSLRPLLAVSDAYIEKANSGEQIEIALAKYVRNPFPGEPFSVVSAKVRSGDGGVDREGMKLFITPGVSFHGKMVIDYRVVDATGDNDRIVAGVVTLVVRDRPDPPQDVSAVATSGSSAAVSFVPGAHNGAAISGFIVHVADRRVSCKATTICVVKDLTPGTEYSFKVSAVNDAGESDVSLPSPAVLIDVVSERPAAVRIIDVGDKQFTVSWGKPKNTGSEVLRYHVSVNGSDVREVAGGRTSLHITGLRNGESYRASVIAENKAGMSPVSDLSNEAVPYGQPFAPEGVKFVYESSDDPVKSKVVLSWNYSGTSILNNGRPMDKVRIHVNDDTSVLSSLDLTKVTREVRPGVLTRLGVSVHTAADWGSSEGWSDIAWTQWFTPVAAPEAVSVPQVRPSGENNQVTVSGLSRKAGNGWNVAGLVLQYQVGDGEWRPVPAGCVSGACRITSDALVNGSSSVLRFRQVGSVGYGEKTGRKDVVGAVVSSDSFITWGSVVAPELHMSWHSDGLRVSWSGSGNGRPVSKVTLMFDGSEVATSSPAGRMEFSGSHTIGWSDFTTTTQTVKLSFAVAADKENHSDATASSFKDKNVKMGDMGVAGVVGNIRCPVTAVPDNGDAPVEGNSEDKSCAKATVTVGEWEPSASFSCTVPNSNLGNFSLSSDSAHTFDKVFSSENEAKDALAGFECKLR